MAAAFVVLAYLAGSIPTGVLLARTAGVDVRAQGSGNVGATNVARTVGKKLGILTLAGDLLKGLAPVLLARSLEIGSVAVGLVAVAAIFGHVFSVFLNFQGGKGVATGFGVLLGLAPAAALIPLAVFAGAFSLSRIVSLSSIAAAASAPLALLLIGYPSPTVLAAFATAVLIISRHRDNISRLMAGTEQRFRSRD
jgi:glycerol-3-phosphate acyltransferase PlsY